MRSLLALLLSITVVTSIPFEASAQARSVNVRDLVTKSCRYYRGESLDSLMTPQGQMNNPLLASPIGRLSYVSNFREGFVNTNFTGIDQLIDSINNSPDLDAALDQCYGKNEQAKITFLMLMNQIQYQAKSDAFLVSIGSFFVQGALVLKVATKIPFAAGAAAWLKSIGTLRFQARLVLLSAGLVGSKAVYKLIQYKRGKIEAKKVELPTISQEDRASAIAELRAEQESLDSIKAFAIQDLEKSIHQLRQQAPSIKDTSRRASLETLLRQSEQTLKTLKAS